MRLLILEVEIWDGAFHFLIIPRPIRSPSNRSKSCLENGRTFRALPTGLFRFGLEVLRLLPRGTTRFDVDASFRSRAGLRGLRGSALDNGEQLQAAGSE